MAVKKVDCKGVGTWFKRANGVRQRSNAIDTEVATLCIVDAVFNEMNFMACYG